MLRPLVLYLSILSLARADDLDDLDSGDASKAFNPSSSSIEASLPLFTPASIEPPFLEQFDDSSWSDRWTPSAAATGKEGQEELNYVGRWAREQPHVYKGMENDYGLVLKDDARRHAISAPFAHPIDNTGKTLVLQYEVKMQKGLECGGAYLKLLTESPVGIQAQQFSGDTPYTIMFGPDKCGATNKVHFIFRHYNPISQKHEEKHLSSPPVAKISKLSTLYTLVVRPDQSFEISINNKSVKKGSLLEDFSPPVNPEKQIDDPEDRKPENWVEEAKIDDPNALKPADWDEDEPFEIPDPEAEKPADWLDDEPAMVSDPDAAKPEDWDDEEDGTWIAPKVPNPKCVDGQGCGEWIPPKIKNPNYKGKWFAPKIDNPDYIGIWKPRKIDNPDYFEDIVPSNFDLISGIGFELWTMQGDILFDNIVLSHDLSDAEELAKDWQSKFSIEEAEDNAAAPLATDAAKEKYAELSFTNEPLQFILQHVSKFVSLAQMDPLFAVKNMPEVVGGLVAALVTLFAIIGSLVGMFSGPKQAQSNKTQLKKVADISDQKPANLDETSEADSINSKADAETPIAKSRGSSKKA